MNIFVKIIIGAITIIGLVVIVMFTYNKNSGGGAMPSPISSIGQLPIYNSVQEEKKVIELAENFVSGYGTFQKGSYSYLRGLTDKMTYKYKNETINFIEEQEQKQSGNYSNIEYISYSSIPKKTNILFYNTQTVEAVVDFESNTFYGVHTYRSGTLKTLDQFGNVTSSPLKRELSQKIAVLVILKENGAWKVESIDINDKYDK